MRWPTTVLRMAGERYAQDIFSVRARHTTIAVTRRLPAGDERVRAGVIAATGAVGTQLTAYRRVGGMNCSIVAHARRVGSALSFIYTLVCTTCYTTACYFVLEPCRFLRGPSASFFFFFRNAWDFEYFPSRHPSLGLSPLSYYIIPSPLTILQFYYTRYD